MLLTVRSSACATTEHLQAHRAVFAEQDVQVQRSEEEAVGRYLLALEAGDTVESEQAAALCRLLEEDAPAAVEVCIHRPSHDRRATLLRRQVRVVRNRGGMVDRLQRPASPGDEVLTSDVVVRNAAACGQAGHRRQLDQARSGLRTQPNDAYLLLLAGEAELELGDSASAGRLLERALRFTPEQARWQAPVRNALARALHQQGEHELAEQQIRVSVGAASEQWQGWALLVEHHLLRLRHADVIEAAARCLRTRRSELHSDLIPDRASLLQQLGMAELLRHHPTDAAAHLREALELGLAADADSEVCAHYLAMAERMLAGPRA